MANHTSKWDFLVLNVLIRCSRKVKKLRQTPQKHVEFPEKEWNNFYFELSLKYVLARLI